MDSFLNHQMDVMLFQEMGKEFLRLFGDCGVTKILTIEASGIGIACVTAQFFDCPVIFAKKNKTRNIAGDVYTCLLYTSRQRLVGGEHIAVGGGGDGLGGLRPVEKHVIDVGRGGLVYAEAGSGVGLGVKIAHQHPAALVFQSRCV